MALEEKEVLQTLLAEYATLKSEIINRTNNGYQLVTVGVAALALVLTSARSFCAGVLLFLFLLTVIAVSGRLALRDILKAAFQVRELEGRINKMSPNEKLLRSESDLGGGANGFWWGFWDFWPFNTWNVWPFNSTGTIPQ